MPCTKTAKVGGKWNATLKKSIEMRYIFHHFEKNMQKNKGVVKGTFTQQTNINSLTNKIIPSFQVGVGNFTYTLF